MSPKETLVSSILLHKKCKKRIHVGLDLGFTHGEYSRHNASVNANINTGNFNFFGNYNANLGKNYFNGNVQNYDTMLDQYFDVLNDNKSQLFKVGFDWFISEKSAMTIYTSQNFFKGDGPSNSNVFDNNNRILYNNLSENLWKYRNQDYSFNFKQDFEKDDHHIVLDAIYSTSNNDDFRDYRNECPILNAPHLYVEKRDGGMIILESTWIIPIKSLMVGKSNRYSIQTGKNR